MTGLDDTTAAVRPERERPEPQPGPFNDSVPPTSSPVILPDEPWVSSSGDAAP
jgi:hypothetical protein